MMLAPAYTGLAHTLLRPRRRRLHPAQCGEGWLELVFLHQRTFDGRGGPVGMSPYTDVVQFWLPWLYRLADNYGNTAGLYDMGKASGWDVAGQASLFSFGLGVTGFAWEKTATDILPRVSAGVSYAAGHVYETPVMQRTLEYTAGRVARGFCSIVNTVTPIYSDFKAIWDAKDRYKKGAYHWELTEDGWLNKKADDDCMKKLGTASLSFFNSFIQGIIGIGAFRVRR